MITVSADERENLWIGKPVLREERTRERGTHLERRDGGCVSKHPSRSSLSQLSFGRSNLEESNMRHPASTRATRRRRLRSTLSPLFSGYLDDDFGHTVRRATDLSAGWP